MTGVDPPPPPSPSELDRRRFLIALASAGMGGGLFAEALWARAQATSEIDEEVIAAAEKIAGLTFSPDQRAMMVERLRQSHSAYEALREVELPYDVSPAIHFDPLPPGTALPVGASFFRPSRPRELPDPDDASELVFASVTQLSVLLRERRITSEELTAIYLDRLRRFDDRLHHVVTLTEGLAMEQARRADGELDAGRVRSPLHGVPWGAKDLLATRGFPTTWGALPFREQRFDTDATVVRRLHEAGAVMVAKLSLGSLAMGDTWFGGQTRNPWNLEQGSSGSSAGSAAATVSGSVGFSIGSETLGSIVSPAARCGVTGLRPTFGRVSRQGAMALSWTMDKLGPICRSAEDCALVLEAIRGPDALDRSVRDVPFEWVGESGLEGIRVGFLAASFERAADELDRDLLGVLAGLGAALHPVELPEELPIGALRLILDAEAAAAFDDLTRSGDDVFLDRQDPGGWPNLFRAARLIPAVEYLRANRVRTLLVSELERAWSGVDVVVASSATPNLVLATNLTGHPAVVLPHGFRSDGTPASVTFIGGLWKDAEALQVARAYQEVTEHHLRRPPGFA